MGKKLIEVALPLEAINAASSGEKYIRQGNPSTLHPWWSRKPLATSRAVLFASLVDDPSANPAAFPTEESQRIERQRLFRIIEDLVQWKNMSDPDVLSSARAEVLHSTGGGPPRFLDPFAGGGSIPLEAQRLGLEVHAGDLNPVAVLLSKAIVEIPPKFAYRVPVHPDSNGSQQLKTWSRAEGLADDVRYYGRWMRGEAEKRIGHLYPGIEVPSEDQVRRRAPLLAWIWARVMTCPHPACRKEMPLVSKLTLSAKKGQTPIWAEPRLKRGQLTFAVRTGGTVPRSPKTGKGANFRCYWCQEPVREPSVKAAGKAGEIRSELMAVVVGAGRSRTYLDPVQPEAISQVDSSLAWRPEFDMCTNPRWYSPPEFGLTTFADQFTERQLIATTVFADLVREARELVLVDAEAQMELGERMADGGVGAAAYADAVATYLGLSVGKLVVFTNVLARWRAGEGKSAPALGRQAVAMPWEYAEVNPFAGAGGDWLGIVDGTASVIEQTPAGPPGEVNQLDATSVVPAVGPCIVSTDPPYYDYIGYADLSDFFYLWLRRALRDVFPTELSTVLSPKTQELLATPFRFNGNRLEARDHFEAGLRASFENIHATAGGDWPTTIYYAFKQSEETDSDGRASTGWETMLESLLASGFAVHGTWPMRSELATRMVAREANSLASTILLVCRPRPEKAPLATRREFVAALRATLPSALRHLQEGSIAPVDLAQAAIGPGMGVFSGFSRIVEADGSAMTVRTALGLINQVLDETLAEQEGDFDPDTRWAVAWFEQFGIHEGAYGEAETLSKAKNTAVAGLVEAGVLESKAGKVRLIGRDEMSAAWDPATDTRLTVWEVTQHLIRALAEGGEQAAADLLRRIGPDLGETARELSYRLYTICERKQWPNEALAYNSLVVAWPTLVQRQGESTMRQDEMF